MEQNNSIARVGRHQTLIQSNPPAKVGHLEQVTQECLRVGGMSSERETPEPPWATSSSALPPSLWISSSCREEISCGLVYSHCSGSCCWAPR